MDSLGIPDDSRDPTELYLLERKTRGVVFGLERMRRFLAALGHPEQRLPCIHVAGTNGKGSVAAMLEAILRTAGWRTGLYTSPHLVRLGERVQIDRQLLAPAELRDAVVELRPIVESIEARGGREAGPSYFEFMTGLALWHFVRRQCAVAVIETGLGGRLDATNVVTPEVSVITSIGLDHCDVLGGTLSAIAAEKAGIIKPRRPVALGRVPPEAELVIRKTAAAQQATVHSVREVYGEDMAGLPATNLAGGYQRWNAATASLAARALDLRWRVTAGQVASALTAVRWPGRWERLRAGDREVIVDSAHNAEGAAALEANLQDLEAETGQRPVIIAGVLGEARAAAVMPVLCRHAREIHLVVPRQSRACTVDQLRRFIAPAFPGRVVEGRVETLFPAAGRCAAGEPGEVIVVTGSIYLAGEVLARLDPQQGSAESQLQDF